ncbi:MAG: sugar phosphate isomerase/epimerase [Verrucomicrobiota bacterium]
MKRRRFLRTSLTALPFAASSIPLPSWALEASSPFRKNIGIQLYTLRNPIKKDVAGTLKAVADAGYKQVEAYGFPGPGAADMIREAKANGLAANSSHFAWESVTDPEKKGVKPFDEILAGAKEAGLSHLVIPYLHGHNRKTLDDYKRVAERCNAAAVKSKAAGIQLAYHNHAFEFQPLEGQKSGFDVFVEEFASEMQFELDVFWVKVGGLEPTDLIRKLKGRVSQLHLKDLQKGTSLPNFGQLPPEAFKELGNGMIPMEPIVEAAGDAGVAHCHVEQDQSPDPIASVKESMAYLTGL